MTNEQFRTAIDDLFASGITDLAQKGAEIERLTARYFAANGKQPQPAQLDRLTTWYLKGVEKDGDDLVLTERQMRYRNREKEFSFDNPEVYFDRPEDDGNKIVKPVGDETGYYRKTKVKYPNDGEDMRKFNAPVRKYTL